VRAIERLTSARQRLVTSSEVFQEILHRYASVRLHARIQPAFDVLSATVDSVLPDDELDVLAAKDIVLARAELPARDALHVAVMHHHAISEILTFDRHFDLVPGLIRLPS
jgi:predicted nucleic acid-binding protein